MKSTCEPDWDTECYDQQCEGYEFDPKLIECFSKLKVKPKEHIVKKNESCVVIIGEGDGHAWIIDKMQELFSLMIFLVSFIAIFCIGNFIMTCIQMMHTYQHFINRQ